MPKVIEHRLGVAGLGIEEQNLRADLVDRDHFVCVVHIRHRFGGQFLPAVAAQESARILKELSQCEYLPAINLTR